LQAARDKLTGLLKSRFLTNEDAAADLNVYLRRPTPENAEPLAGHILEAGLDRDQQILAAARQLLDASGPTVIGPGSIAAESISQINKDEGPDSSVGSTCIITRPPPRLPQRIGSSSTSVARCSSSAT